MAADHQQLMQQLRAEYEKTKEELHASALEHQAAVMELNGRCRTVPRAVLYTSCCASWRVPLGVIGVVLQGGAN